MQHQPQVCLVADDEEPIRALLRAILENERFRVVEASNGNEALAVLNQFGPNLDFVISDFQMCGGDGLRFVLDARQLYPHLPIVLISGFVRPAGNASTEYFEFLQKPFSRSMLLESIARARQKVRRTNTGTA